MLTNFIHFIAIFISFKADHTLTLPLRSKTALNH